MRCQAAPPPPNHPQDLTKGTQCLLCDIFLLQLQHSLRQLQASEALASTHRRPSTTIASKRQGGETTVKRQYDLQALHLGRRWVSALGVVGVGAGVGVGVGEGVGEGVSVRVCVHSEAQEQGKCAQSRSTTTHLASPPPPTRLMNASTAEAVARGVPGSIVAVPASPPPPIAPLAMPRKVRMAAACALNLARKESASTISRLALLVKREKGQGVQHTVPDVECQ